MEACLGAMSLIPYLDAFMINNISTIFQSSSVLEEQCCIRRGMSERPCLRMLSGIFRALSPWHNGTNPLLVALFRDAALLAQLPKFRRSQEADCRERGN